jgi:hypothetical protein
VAKLWDKVDNEKLAKAVESCELETRQKIAGKVLELG